MPINKKGLDIETYPRGFTAEDRNQWHENNRRQLELYCKLPANETKRRVVACGDDRGGVCVFFKGDFNDLIKFRNIIEDL